MAPIILKIKGNKSFSPIANVDNEEELSKSWRCLTKVANVLENGSRLENLSWRLWHLMSVMKDSNQNSKSVNKHFRILSTNTTKKLETEKGTALSQLQAPVYKGNGKVPGSYPLAAGIKAPAKPRSHKRREKKSLPSHPSSTPVTTPPAASSNTSSTGMPKRVSFANTAKSLLDKSPQSLKLSSLSYSVPVPAPPSSPSTQPFAFNPEQSYQLDDLFSSFNVQAFLNASAPPMLQIEDIYDEYSPYTSQVPTPSGVGPEDYFSQNPDPSVWCDIGLPSTFDYDVDANMNPSQASQAAVVLADSSAYIADEYVSTKSKSLDATISPTIAKPKVSAPASASSTSTSSIVVAAPKHAPHQHSIHPPSATSSATSPQVCTNCSATSTPLWRRSAEDNLLCNACGLYLKLHKAPRPRNMKPHVLRKGDPRYDEEENLPPPVCANCQTITTPLWRRDDSGQTLCNACGLYLKLHHEQRPLSMKTDIIKKRHRFDHDDPTPKKRKKSSSSEDSSSQSSSGATTPTEADQDSISQSAQFAKFAAALSATREQLRAQGQPVSATVTSVLPMLPDLTPVVPVITVKAD